MQTMGWMVSLNLSPRPFIRTPLTPAFLQWLHDNLPRRRTDKSIKYWLLVALNVFLISAGFFVQISGTIGAAISIKNSYKTGAVNRYVDDAQLSSDGFGLTTSPPPLCSPFSCVDNSGS